MGNPHVIAIPTPAQGHVIPLLELSQRLAKRGVKVTFVNTEFNHQRILASLSESEDVQELVTMVSIPDGLEPWDDRKDFGKLADSVSRVMPAKLKALIEKINENERRETICIVADWTMGWAFEVAEKMGLGRAAFLTAPAAEFALSFNIPRLVSDGIIDNNGRSLKNQTVRLSPTMLPMNTTNFMWLKAGDEATQKTTFELYIKHNQSVKSTDWLICNSCYDLEPGVFPLFPNILPVGPLLASNRRGKSVGHFWPEDSDCLAWLDQQPANSVIYVAFGSFTVFDQKQFEELALGLELTNRPFLWVVRKGIATNTDVRYPEGFKERVNSRGRMVRWAPQQQVLSHPSVACFISHCGWNSTLEGIGNGVPFLCWPYFADQFLNQTYICDEWKIGLGLSKDESGIIRRQELKEKVQHLLSDKSYKERVLNLQAKTMESVRGGHSHKNFNKFIDWIKSYKEN